MNFRPTLAQLENLAEMFVARATAARMAEAVGLALDAFIAWRQRSLAAVRAEENAVQAGYEAMAPEPVRRRAEDCGR